MNTQSSWEAQTQELLDRTNQILKELQEEADSKMQPYLDRRWGLIQALEAYREMMGTETTQTNKSLSKEDVENKTQIEILKLLAERNNKLLVARTAIKLMKEASIFGNPNNAPAQVYSLLRRSKDFYKVGKGVYKLNGVHKQNKVKKNVRKPSLPLLKESIKALKEQSPALTKEEVREILIKRGFDFQDRNPGKSVHMAWVNLGYAKKTPKPVQKVHEIIVPESLREKITGHPTIGDRPTIATPKFF